MAEAAAPPVQAVQIPALGFQRSIHLADVDGKNFNAGQRAAIWVGFVNPIEQHVAPDAVFAGLVDLDQNLLLDAPELRGERPFLGQRLPAGRATFHGRLALIIAKI